MVHDNKQQQSETAILRLDSSKTKNCAKSMSDNTDGLVGAIVTSHDAMGENGQSSWPELLKVLF